MTSICELNGFRVEAALQFGFEMYEFEPDNDDVGEFRCTEAQLLAFARACERKGRADAAKLARNPHHSWPVSLNRFADHIESLADATDEQIAREIAK